MRFFLFLIIIIHGLIHLIGFAKAFKLADVTQITNHITEPVGALWLLCAVLFTVAAVLVLLKKEDWWMIAGPAVVLSQTLVMLSWSDAKIGTIVNFIVLFPLIISFMNAQPSGFRNVGIQETCAAFEVS